MSVNLVSNEEVYGHLVRQWDMIKDHIFKEYKLTAISYKTWIQPLTIDSVNGTVVNILIHSDQTYMKQYITEGTVPILKLP